VHRVYKWLWKSACQNKRKIFLLVLKDRLSTRSLLRRRHMHLPDYNCVFCMLNIEEDLLHLLFHCPFAHVCWFSLNVYLPNSDDILVILESIKDQINLPFFMEIIIKMCWAIWIMCNDTIFKNIFHSVQSCKTVFKKDFALVILRAKSTLHPFIDLWPEGFV
jgi:hypothetical protein